jgi:energy-coupling factor transport system ATP-binding protein
VSELRAANVSFSYGGTVVLERLDLRVAVGEFVVIRGANGSGKTTLLKLLAGLLVPAEGRVTISDTPVAAQRNLTGLLFQNPDHQMMAPTVEEELALGLEMRGWSRADMRCRVDELLDEFDLRALAKRPPEALSGGQKQRVALAAIMAVRPRFLLMDEPDSYLDAPARKQLQAVLTSLRGTCGMVWTASRLQRTLPVDRFLILESGRLFAFAPASTIVHEQLEMFAGDVCG